MCNRQEFCPFGDHGRHKGFYNDEDSYESLKSIPYSDFFVEPADDEFPYDSVGSLLCGVCHLFALSLKKLLNYDVCVIEKKDNKNSFHAFCQVYRDGECYYVDARGVTSSFDEFMNVAKNFVGEEYIIRPVLDDEIREWETDGDYSKEGCEFAEAVIIKYEECYTL